MKGLLYKDFSVLANSYKRNALLVVVLYIVIVIASRQAYLAYALTVMGSIYASSTVSFDEQANWDAYARTMPVTARQIVGAKYLLCVLSTAVLGLVSTVLLLVLLPLTAGLAGDAASLPAAAENMAGVLSCAGVSMLMTAVTLPFSYKYGGAKARSYMGVTFGVVFFLLIFAMNGMPDPQRQTMITFLKNLNGAALPLAGILLIVVFVAISYAVCVRIYENSTH